jgi:hypothetical protein
MLRRLAIDEKRAEQHQRDEAERKAKAEIGAQAPATAGQPDQQPGQPLRDNAPSRAQRLSVVIRRPARSSGTKLRLCAVRVT